jgi:hypothetical protein
MRRAARILGTVMIVAGVCSIAWALVVWQWQDPFTAIYAKYEQHKLASTYAKRFADYQPPTLPAVPTKRGPTTQQVEQRRIRSDAPRPGACSRRASRSAG